MFHSIRILRVPFVTNTTFVFRFSVQNVSDKIFALIRELAGGNKAVRVPEVMERCTTKGYKPDQVSQCLEDYEALNVWQVNQTKTKITFV